MEKVGPEARLPLVDLAIASLKDLSGQQYTAFVDNVRSLIAADQRVDLFEYVISRMIRRHLAPTFGRFRPPAVKYHSLNALRDECGRLLSCLAYRGADDASKAPGAFARGIERLNLKRPPAISAQDACGLNALDVALAKLGHGSGAVKRRVLEACTEVVSSDNKITVAEAELLRAIADSLDCPVPPFHPGQKV
jgi:hypothetical protein